MSELSKVIQRNTRKEQEKDTSELLKAVRGGTANEGWLRGGWTKSF